MPEGISIKNQEGKNHHGRTHKIAEQQPRKTYIQEKNRGKQTHQKQGEQKPTGMKQLCFVDIYIYIYMYMYIYIYIYIYI
jgi:hypothetical protein